jgi:hypothetical protein
LAKVSILYRITNIHKTYLIMAAYNKINNFCAKSIRKLSDYAVFTQGRRSECTRLSRNTDVWGNDNLETISVSSVPVIFIFPPGEMPLIRLRAGNGTQSEVQSSGLYFYDILPIEVYARWEDRLEPGDVIYFWAGDENGNKMPVVFKILDQKGAFSSQLIWRKFLAAPIVNLETEVPSDLAERLLAEIAG